MPRPLVRIATRFAEVVCPPDVRTQHLAPSLVEELESYLGALPKHLRTIMLALFVFFDQSARFSSPKRLRRFADLDTHDAETYIRACITGSPGLRRTITAMLKGIVTFNYYELPQVKAQLGYRPESYIEQVSERRMRLHGDDVRRREAAVLMDGDGA